MLDDSRPFISPATSNASASWIEPRLSGFAKSVVSYVPDGFEAYARIFHPASLSCEVIEKRVLWRDVAEAAGFVPHHQMQWTEISGDNEWGTGGSELVDVWTQAPSTGTLTPTLAKTLYTELESRTTTPERCWFAVWGGYGYLNPIARSATSFTLPERELHLLQGSVKSINVTFADQLWIYQSANLWWPDDRAWCVASPIDLMSTYIGANADTIASLLENPVIEIYQVSPSDRVS